MVKNLPTMKETRVRSLVWEVPLESGMATHPSILAWRIPWTEEPGGLQSMGLQRVRHDWATNNRHLCLCSVMSDSPTPWSVVCQALLSMEFSRQECWNGLPFPPPGSLPDSEIKPTFPMPPALVGGFFTTEPPGKSGLRVSLVALTVSQAETSDSWTV